MPRLVRQNATMVEYTAKGVVPKYCRSRNVACRTIPPEDTTPNGRKAFSTTSAAAMLVSSVVHTTSLARAPAAIAKTQCQGDGPYRVGLQHQTRQPEVRQGDRRDARREEGDCYEQGEDYKQANTRGQGDGTGTSGRACSDEQQSVGDKEGDTDDSHQAQYLQEAWERRRRLYTWLDQLNLGNSTYLAPEQPPAYVPTDWCGDTLRQ